MSTESTANPIDAFREACADAARIQQAATSATEAEATVDRIRADLAFCEDESEAAKLGKALATAEAQARISAIRGSRATDAWQSAASLASHAIRQATEMVGVASGDSFDQTLCILGNLLPAETREHAAASAASAECIEDAAQVLSGASLGSGLANLLQSHLRSAQQATLLQPPADHCRAVLEALAKAEASIPEIKRQAAQLARIAAAVKAASSTK
jgi:hypothetical protein